MKVIISDGKDIRFPGRKNKYSSEWEEIKRFNNKLEKKFKLNNFETYRVTSDDKKIEIKRPSDASNYRKMQIGRVIEEDDVIIETHFFSALGSENLTLYFNSLVPKSERIGKRIIRNEMEKHKSKIGGLYDFMISNFTFWSVLSPFNNPGLIIVPFSMNDSFNPKDGISKYDQIAESVIEGVNKFYEADILS